MFLLCQKSGWSSGHPNLPFKQAKLQTQTAAAAAGWVHTSCTFIMLIIIMWSLHETKLEGRWFEGSQANPVISILINNSRILKILCLCSLCARLRVGEAQNTRIPLQTSKLTNSNCSSSWVHTSCTFIMLIALMWSLHEPKLEGRWCTGI